MFIATQALTAQTYSLDKANSSIKVDGTSNIHDWTITSEDFQGSMTATVENGQLLKLEALEFTVPAESLKSGKGAMDKNTYKALNTKEHKNITFKLDKVKSLEGQPAGKCRIQASGHLTIAGTRKPIELVFDAAVSGNKISITGTREIKMTDYKVDPPKAMMGTITTGDALEITMKATFNKQ